MKYNLKKNKSYLVNLVVTLDQNDLGHYLEEARKDLANNLRIRGFRKGRAPLEITKDKLNEGHVLNKALDLAMKQSFGEILTKEKIELVDAGSFEVKENSPNRMVYSILLTVFPEFKMADYKNIRIKKNDISVSEEEIDKTVEFIRNSKKQNGVLPEITDEFAKSLGQFKDLKEFRVSVGGGLEQEKQEKESQRIQTFILDKIAGSTKIEVPPLLVDRQLGQMVFDLDADLHRNGLELGLFLAKIKKTQDELKNEWRPKAEVLVKEALIIKEIAKREDMKVEPDEVRERLNQFLQNFATIEKVQKNIDLPGLASQIQQILLNQKVLAFLEKEAVS